MNKKGFTLVELLAVIVIMAVIALIATPITISIINNSKENAHKRSIENYAREIEKGYLEAKMNRLNSIPNTISGLKEEGLIKVSGENVVCDDNYTVNKESIELTNCYVSEKNNPKKQKSKHKYDYKNGKLIQVKEESDDNGNNKEYAIGEEVTVKNEKYNVVGQGSDYVTLLKQQPLTVAEVNANKIGSDGINHVNKNTSSSVGEANNDNGYGEIAYYSSSTCGYNGSSWVNDGCASENATSYDTSDIKYVVDGWARVKFTNELKTVDGYTARLITFDELLPYYPNCTSEIIESEGWCNLESITPSWLYHLNYWYWTMNQWASSLDGVWFVYGNGGLSGNHVGNSNGAVRPVINIKKSAL